MRPSAAPIRAALAAAALVSAAPAAAQRADDAAGDFLPTYTGPRNADVDITQVDFTWNGSDTFQLFSRSAGAVGQTPGALFVWGVDRGQGSAGFPALAPGVLFDAVVIVNPLGASTVRDLVSGAVSTLPVGAVRFLGAELTVDVAAALLPSRGLAPGAYTANLWPRVGTGNNAQISDFAPNNSNVLVTTTPEPGAALLVAPALALAAAAARRRRSAKRPPPTPRAARTTGTRGGRGTGGANGERARYRPAARRSTMRQRSCTTSMPARAKRSADSSWRIPCWNHTARGRASRMSSTCAGMSRGRRNTFTRSTPPGTSATRR